ncbi:unnamed protein product [Larinioides sclopetarius]|uniref:acid phosphatase n=1 Tax=Larinioides sclopetarius TaxID=280406 RepID=A0AAV1ZJI3_9ARAC
MYKDFVTSNPNEIYVNSSGIDRCLDSASSNLASFYSPDERWKLEDDLKWQPIPIHYLPVDIDIYFNNLRSCPRAFSEFLKQINSKEVQDLYQTHQTLVEVVTKESGMNYTLEDNPFELFDTLEIEKKYNLTIPKWADIYWNEMSYIASVNFQAYYSSHTQLRMRAGPFLGLLSNNLMNKINGKTPDLKVVMSSSHDILLATVLRALNFTNMPQPPYCATMLFELHKMAEGAMTVRLLYLNSTDPLSDMGKPHVLTLDNCSEFCPVEYFINSFQSLIPNNWEEECQLNASDIDEN